METTKAPKVCGLKIRQPWKKYRIVKSKTNNRKKINISTVAADIGKMVKGMANRKILMGKEKHTREFALYPRFVGNG